MVLTVFILSRLCGVLLGMTRLSDKAAPRKSVNLSQDLFPQQGQGSNIWCFCKLRFDVHRGMHHANNAHQAGLLVKKNHVMAMGA